MNLDWTIVGGGIHGVHLAARLLDEGDVEPGRLRIVDPGARLLNCWWARAEATGMSYLRSPSVHHLDTNPHSLRRFARKQMEGVPGLFAHPYERPAVELFRAHCDHVIKRLGLAEKHVRDSVVSCELTPHAAELQLAGGGRLSTRNVVLAIGAGDQLKYPDWAPRRDPRIQHVFQRGFNGSPAIEGSRVAVVGGGVSAVQLALRLARGGQNVQLISRHTFQERDFDTGPGWLGPKYMRAFERTRDLGMRRATISEAREGGSVPRDALRYLKLAIERGKIALHQSVVASLDAGVGALRLGLENSTNIEVDGVLLATGFSRVRPGGKMVDDLIRSNSLACAPCGFPVVDSALRWHPRVHVSGPLAELELGPVARNIAGARRAGERILEAVLQKNLARAGERLPALAV